MVNRAARLISYAMHTGGLGAEWRFAQSVIRDFRESTSHEDRRGHYDLFIKVLGSSVPPSGEKTGVDDLYWFSVNWKKLGWQLMSGCCFGYV